MNKLPKDVIELLHWKYLSLRDFMNYGQTSKENYSLFSKHKNYKKMVYRYFPLYEKHPNTDWKERFVSLWKKSEILETITSDNHYTVPSDFVEFFRLSHYGTNQLSTEYSAKYLVLYYYLQSDNNPFTQKGLVNSNLIKNVFKTEDKSSGLDFYKMITSIDSYSDLEIKSLGNFRLWENEIRNLYSKFIYLNLLFYKSNHMDTNFEFSADIFGSENYAYFILSKTISKQLYEEFIEKIKKMDSKVEIEKEVEIKTYELKDLWQELGFPIYQEKILNK